MLVVFLKLCEHLQVLTSSFSQNKLWILANKKARIMMGPSQWDMGPWLSWLSIKLQKSATWQMPRLRQKKGMSIQRTHEGYQEKAQGF